MSEQLQADSVVCCSTGLKLSWRKTKPHNVSAGDPSLTIIVDYGSYAALPTSDRLQLGWLTRGIDRGVGRFWPPKICRKSQSMFWPPENVTFFNSKLLLYNCKFHNINIITSLILLMLTMLLSLCLISPKQTVSSNQCLCCYTGL